jgi:hypothetical protein
MSAVKKVAPANGKVACPFKILIDKQEKLPYQFSDIRSNADTGHRPFDVTKEFVHLENIGDYSLAPPDTPPWDLPLCRVERKSKEDLFGSFANDEDREKFEWKLGLLDRNCAFAAVIVEAEWSEIFDRPPAFSSFSPTSLHRTVLAWQQRFRRVAWSFYPGREAAEIATFWHLYRFHDDLARHRLDYDRRKAEYAAYLEGQRAHRSRQKITDNPHDRRHAHGDLHDHWSAGWLAHEMVAGGRPIVVTEASLVTPESVSRKEPSGADV